MIVEFEVTNNQITNDLELGIKLVSYLSKRFKYVDTHNIMKFNNVLYTDPSYTITIVITIINDSELSTLSHMVNLAIINGSGVGDTDYDEKSFLKISNITTSSGTNTRYDNEVTLFKTIYNNKSAVERFFVRESLNPTHDNDVVEKTTDELYDSLKSSLDRELITPYLGEFYYYELDNCENEWERNDKKIKDIKAYIEKLISYDEYNNYLHRILLVISLGMNVALILHELIK